MFLSWAFALFGTGLLVARVKQRDAYWYGWLAVVMYCFHQSEEHGYDFRGWRYAFVPYMNEGIGTVLFASLCAEGQSSCPLDPKMTLYINTMMIWLLWLHARCTCVPAKVSPRGLTELGHRRGQRARRPRRTGCRERLV